MFVIVGVGRYTECIIELCGDLNIKIDGLYHYDDSRTGECICGYPILGSINDLLYISNSIDVVIGVGNNDIRENHFRLLSQNSMINFPTLIHPSSYISSSCEISKGVVIHAQAFLWTSVKVGFGTIISPKVMISHHSIINKYCFISSGARLGTSVINNNTFVGLNSSIKPDTNIGSNVTIGCASNVINSMPDNCIVAGNPAKVLRNK